MTDLKVNDRSKRNRFKPQKMKIPLGAFHFKLSTDQGIMICLGWVKRMFSFNTGSFKRARDRKKVCKITKT